MFARRRREREGARPPVQRSPGQAALRTGARSSHRPEPFPPETHPSAAAPAHGTSLPAARAPSPGAARHSRRRPSRARDRADPGPGWHWGGLSPGCAETARPPLPDLRPGPPDRQPSARPPASPGAAGSSRATKADLVILVVRSERRAVIATTGASPCRVQSGATGSIASCRPGRPRRRGPRRRRTSPRRSGCRRSSERSRGSSQPTREAAPPLAAPRQLPVHRRLSSPRSAYPCVNSGRAENAASLVGRSEQRSKALLHHSRKIRLGVPSSHNGEAPSWFSERPIAPHARLALCLGEPPS